MAQHDDGRRAKWRRTIVVSTRGSAVGQAALTRALSRWSRVASSARSSATPVPRTG